MLCLSSTTFFSVVLLLVSSDSVHGWGPDGHALVARIAQTLLTDQSTTFVQNHLPSNVNGNMSKVASWADNLLYPDTDPDYLNWQWSKQLHYVDTKDWAGVYDRQNDCNWTSTSGQRCVDGAIQNYTQRLADSQQDPIQRQEALQFLIHFIGDAHQPLHAGFKGDLGGNEIHGHFFGESKRVNLHAVWDTTMIEYKIKQDFHSQPALYFDYLLNLLKTTYAQNVSDWTQCPSSDESRYLACSTSWIQEDAKLDCEFVYLDDDGQRMSPSKAFNLGQTYYNTRMVILEQRLLQAGVRLAAVINKIVPSITSSKEKKHEKTCSETMLFMMVLSIQSTLILILLIILLRRKTTIVIQSPIIGEKNEHEIII